MFKKYRKLILAAIITMFTVGVFAVPFTKASSTENEAALQNAITAKPIVVTSKQDEASTVVVDNNGIKPIVKEVELPPTTNPTIIPESDWAKNNSNGIELELEKTDEVNPDKEDKEEETKPPPVENDISSSAPIEDDVVEVIDDTNTNESIIEGATNVNIYSGEFSIVQTGVTFSPLTIDMKQQYQTTQGSDQIIINDSRGTGLGWNLSVQASNFRLTRTIGGVERTLLLKKEYFQYQVSSIDTFSGQPIEEHINQTSTDMGDSNSLITLPSGSGMGTYNLKVDYVLQIPNMIETMDNKLFPVVAGSYSGEMIYTLTSGI